MPDFLNTFRNIFDNCEHVRWYNANLDLAMIEDATQKETVIILFSNRSGSNLLGRSLATTGIYPIAGEPLNEQTIERSGIRSLGEYLETVVCRQKSQKFALKTGITQLMFLKKSGLLDRHFPDRKIIRTYREDIISQAVSWSIASQRNVWHQSDAPGDRFEEVEYDQSTIEDFLQGIAIRESFERMFLATDVAPSLTISYEQMTRDAEKTSLAISEFLGVPAGSLSFEDVGIVRQSNRTNREHFEWFAKYFLQQFD